MKEYEQKWLNQLDTLIEQKLHYPTFKQADLVAIMKTSPAQFYRQVVKLVGMSPNQYIRLKRLMAAKKLLERGTYATVTEVALAVGYQHAHYFSSVYEKQFGKRPSEYLK